METLQAKIDFITSETKRIWAERDTKERRADIIEIMNELVKRCFISREEIALWVRKTPESLDIIDDVVSEYTFKAFDSVGTLTEVATKLWLRDQVTDKLLQGE